MSDSYKKKKHPRSHPSKDDSHSPPVTINEIKIEISRVLDEVRKGADPTWTRKDYLKIASDIIHEGQCVICELTSPFLNTRSIKGNARLAKVVYLMMALEKLGGVS